MAEITWNDGQLDAIGARGGTVLVSAAAGSGKTAVLTERVIRMLTDPDEEKRVDADRLVIVTFSNSAAAEMKSRIAERLAAKLSEQPRCPWLMRQRFLLQSANICTIHSFCSKLLREHFHEAGLAPDFRIAGGGELETQRERLWSELLEEEYAENDPRFASLVECVCKNRDDEELVSALKKLESFVSSDPFPRQMLERLSEGEESAAIGETKWGRALLEQLRALIECARDCFDEAGALAATDERMAKAYSEYILTGADKARCLLLKLGASWDELRQELSSISYPRLGSVYDAAKKCPELLPCIDRIKRLLALGKKLFERAGTLVVSTQSEYKEDALELRGLEKKLCELVTRFLDRLDAYKKRKNVLEFSDLELMTVELLVSREGDRLFRKETAVALSHDFSEIMLDEYQDTSPVQDLIFRALSAEDGTEIVSESNLFLVGDMKQSIYRFRKAMSELFASRFKSYEPYLKEKPEFPARIILSENYRSREEVTESVNFIFGQLMSEKCGDIEYDDSQKLNPAAEYEKCAGMESELHILEDGQNEAEYIAELIRSMIDGGFRVRDRKSGLMRGAQPRDFCILRHSVKGERGLSLASALKKRALGCWLSDESGFFERTEIKVAMSCLRVLDDPLNDVSLLAVLVSPMFGFTPDELASIRTGESKSLYSAVLKAAQGGSPKAERFARVISRLKLLSVTLPADRLTSEMLRLTDYGAAVSAQEDGEMRLANLNMLVSYASGYEEAGFKGLSRFISQLDRMIARGETLATASGAGESANVVKVMTIHKSKGLEFPVCIIAGLKRRGGSYSSHLSLSQKYGMSMLRRKSGPATIFATQHKTAIDALNEAEERSERMRVLYVALTRAREKLIMVASVTDSEKYLLEVSTGILGGRIPPAILSVRSDYADWLTMCALRHPDSAAVREMCALGEDCVVSSKARLKLVLPKENRESEGVAVQSVQETQAEPDAETAASLEERFDYRYPYAYLDRVPSKVITTELNKRLAGTKATALSRPAFLQKQRMTAGERGSALHRYMETADFERAKADAAKELERLKDEGFLTEREAQCVDCERVRAFFESEISRLLSAAREIQRERRFTVRLPEGYASVFSENGLGGESIVLQGACDCVLVFEGSAMILDYKTDAQTEEAAYVEEYGYQLRLYADAMEQVLELPVERISIYSFTLGRLIDIPR